MAFKFPVINPLLHNELRLKIMVALDSLESANFMYLCEITGATRGNLSIQIKTLQEAGYLQMDKSGSGPASRSICRITRKGTEALRAYEQGLRRLFSEGVPKSPGETEKKKTG
ncbi:MAG: transcriptional regulator [Prevotella sp.]|jgi:DNA-binding MarR family transcriptional regulator|nr:transcriptional regulator [Prevotella sp.]MBO7129800.1 transcriptional regulator [Prevotella sp.]